MANVSKLKGLSKSVIGSSFIISTKTNTPPATIEGLINGRVTFATVPEKLTPRVLLAHIRFGEVFSIPDKIAP
ncbi:hypothetical protein OAI35_01015 [Paracoccaceae bacterium]|nr:hypothetical protein [Paracoccaceae bacterium]